MNVKGFPACFRYPPIETETYRRYRRNWLARQSDRFLSEQASCLPWLREVWRRDGDEEVRAAIDWTLEQVREEQMRRAA